ncbi:hypothetical protein [Actomonas aquatica]|uniref:L-fucose isomerase C-terminal domain-containing protein n=1 Tax=Actomonas aquatica TaxID=2866162 RepID=A0ABZ1CEP9_9BACT|nr:hypothetical protein [Opitutus sp. WL0086]WRQ89926.1 hypothetical protein K1X11_010955 [Opitutus sp. WL0086]
MSHSPQLRQNHPIDVFLFASPVYWPDEAIRAQQLAAVKSALTAAGGERWRFQPVTGADEAQHLTAAHAASTDPCIVIALSGGVQPWMRSITANRPHLALFNAYLPEALPDFPALAGRLMHANAHPANTDFFAACRLAGKSVRWIDNLSDLIAYADAWQATTRLRRARLLKIGETEPWVINSCREPATIAQRLGTEVIPLDREALYDVYHQTGDDAARAEAEIWAQDSSSLIDINTPDILKACRVTAAMRTLLKQHDADGLSMACFAMIGDLDTTSCLALSSLNSSATAIGACEGDLDAALTLFLLKSLGADFVWIANPIIHADNTVDLAHCTAPTCACQEKLGYQLMRHHESGRGVSPEVVLPDALTASAVRLSVNAQALTCHVGLTQRQPKLPACHTQIRLHVESSQRVLDSLLGTHVVLAYGDYQPALRYAADFLGLDATITSRPATPEPLPSSSIPSAFTAVGCNCAPVPA